MAEVTIDRLCEAIDCVVWCLPVSRDFAWSGSYPSDEFPDKLFAAVHPREDSEEDWQRWAMWGIVPEWWFGYASFSFRELLRMESAREFVNYVERGLIFAESLLLGEIRRKLNSYWSDET